MQGESSVRRDPIDPKSHASAKMRPARPHPERAQEWINTNLLVAVWEKAAVPPVRRTISHREDDPSVEVAFINLNTCARIMCATSKLDSNSW